MDNRYILVVHDSHQSYYKPFAHLGLRYTTNPDVLFANPAQVALVVFTGGEDVSPNLYGRTVHPRTGHNPRRDDIEAEVFEAAQDAGIPMAGICRGAQFICVMAGGRLVQDVTDHCVNHQLAARYPDGQVRNIEVTSSHHQMPYPFEDLREGEDFEVLAEMAAPRSRHYAFDAETTLTRQAAEADDHPILREPDVIWYPGIEALAAQYHPEWMAPDSDGFQYFKQLVDHYLAPIIHATDGTRAAAATTAG